ncbi:MAG: AAA family ATPase [Actinobacteria bacterium]|nr:AAA family ATPase [Actinomycetota bacterium]
MPRYFNTGGTCRPDVHYMIPAVGRLPEARGLVERGAYFVIHAPRQTGKTTTIRALAAELCASGAYAALAFSCEAGSAAGDDYAAAQTGILNELRQAAAEDMPRELQPPPFPDAPPLGMIRNALSAWARACPRPLVLFLDEIDALSGQSLEAVLRQLRAGHERRPANFPASIALCGMRNIRDYKAASGGGPVRIGSPSPFNVLVKSLRMGNFTAAEVADLYGQHTTETGQAFSDAAIARVVEVSGGQPWLVNALAREILEEMRVVPPEPITLAHVDEAKERLILARATHLDSLAARLQEARVQRVIEPVLDGALAHVDLTYSDDLAYLRDLGLVAQASPVQIANPIYREVIARVLADPVQSTLTIERASFVLPDGRLDMKKLLTGFAAFWREQGEALIGTMTYHEVAPQLVLMAYLQKLANGGGYIDREYGLGRRRIDLLLRWPFRDAEGRRAEQREALELKVWRPREKDPLDQGLVQLDGYLERLGLGAGTLVIFDRRGGKRKSGVPKLGKAKTPSGRKVALLRL